MVILCFENNINNKTISMKWKILAYFIIGESLAYNKYNEKCLKCES